MTLPAALPPTKTAHQSLLARATCTFICITSRCIILRYTVHLFTDILNPLILYQQNMTPYNICDIKTACPDLMNAQGFGTPNLFYSLTFPGKPVTPLHFIS